MAEPTSVLTRNASLEGSDDVFVNAGLGSKSVTKCLLFSVVSPRSITSLEGASRPIRCSVWKGRPGDSCGHRVQERAEEVVGSTELESVTSCVSTIRVSYSTLIPLAY